MGEAKRRRLAGLMPGALDTDLVTRCASAVARTLRATSDRRGQDCAIAARLLEALMHLNGIPQARAVAGWAAWRVGPGDGDVVGHCPQVAGTTAGGGNFLGHVWVRAGRHIVDPTAWQWPHKLQIMDAAHGMCSTCRWQVDVLVLDRSEITCFAGVRDGFVHAAWYEERPELQRIVDAAGTVDPGLLMTTRFALTHPDAHISGIGSLAYAEVA